MAERALTQTRSRVAHFGERVTVESGAIPQAWPDGRFDLIVLSEVAYYCRDLDGLLARVEASLTDDGILIACHWRHDAPDHALRAEQVHDALGALARSTVHHAEDDFLLDVWSRDGRSVATATGMLE